MKKQIFILPFILFIFSCSQEPQLTELEIQDGVALFNGESYTGPAKTFYDAENKSIKTNTMFTDGLKESYELLSEQGARLINETYVNNLIVERIYFVNEEPFITQSFNNNNLTNTSVNSLMCESECIVEGLKLKDISLYDLELRNVVFKNVDFENVSILSKNADDSDSLSTLDTVSFKDSKLINVNFKDIAFLTEASNADFQKKKCIERYGSDYPEESLQMCIEDNRYDQKEYHDEFPLNLTFDNVTGKIAFDLGAELGTIKISNSTIDNLSFVFLGEYTSDYNLIEINDSTINYVDKLMIYDGFMNPAIGLVTTLIDDPSAISCQNSSINDGNLAFVLNICDDFGENFDEFALRDFEKTFIPDNTIYRLSRYLENDDYITSGYSDREYFINQASSDEDNQRYAIASGDKEWLMGYLNEVYTYPFAGDNNSDLDNNGDFRELSPCSDGNLLYFLKSGYFSSIPEECQIDFMDHRSFREWFYIPESNRSNISDRQLELLVYYLDGGYSYEDKNRLDELKKTKFQDTDFSDGGKKNAIQKYVNDNHNLDGLQNCLRGRHVNGVRDSMNSIEQINQTTKNKRERQERAEQLMLHSSLSNDEGVQKFSECLIGNLTIYTSQVMEAYKPFSNLARVHREEIEIYADAELRKEQELRKQRIAKRKAQFKAFDDNGYANFCNVALSGDFAFLLNMNLTGNPSAWQSRIERNYNACKNCVFDFYSSKLTDEEFEKLISDESTTPESFSLSSDRKLLMCPVAGADRNVKNMYELMIMSSN